jgi:hypothetical protein
VNLPGSAKLHLYTGLLIALVGVLVGGYAYTGSRIYDIVYLPVALLGLALVLGGSALAGYGQANRPRLGGRGGDDEPGAIEKLEAWIADLRSDDEGDEAVEADDAGEDEEPAAASEDGAESAEEPASAEPA